MRGITEWVDECDLSSFLSEPASTIRWKNDQHQLLSECVQTDRPLALLKLCVYTDTVITCSLWLKDISCSIREEGVVSLLFLVHFVNKDPANKMKQGKVSNP